MIKDIRNLFKGEILRSIRDIYEQEEEEYYKLKVVGRHYNGNYIEYESNSDKIKTINWRIS